MSISSMDTKHLDSIAIAETLISLSNARTKAPKKMPKLFQGDGREEERETEEEEVEVEEEEDEEEKDLVEIHGMQDSSPTTVTDIWSYPRRTKTMETPSMENESNLQLESFHRLVSYVDKNRNLIAETTKYIGTYSPTARRKRIQKFIEKRKKRVWAKKVDYGVRKNFADSRLRVKGRFVKKGDEELLCLMMSFT